MSGGRIITLLTDFGTTDSYVAEVKGVLLSARPDAVLIDVTHDVPPGDVLTAQYVLGRTWHRFPVRTVHFVVVDPGVGTSRRALALWSADHFFVGPDNGLLTPVLDGARVVELAVPPAAAPTFHGRDVFAPAAAALASGGRLETLGAPLDDPVRRPPPVPREQDGRIEGAVVYVDRFGTLVTNIPVARLTGGALVSVAGRDVGPLQRTFGDVHSGGLVAVAGSGGMVEVAVRDGSATRVLGAGVGTVVRARPPR